MKESPRVQKFIQRNRAPRVQIEYEVYAYGANKQVSLPLVIGVMGDLSCGSTFLAGRRPITIDVDNFEQVLREFAPEIEIEFTSSIPQPGSKATARLRFESLDDFNPGTIVTRLPSTRPLMEVRTQLTNLLSYMDGKAEAENLLSRALQDPALLASLAVPKTPSTEDTKAPPKPDIEPDPRGGRAGVPSESALEELMQSTFKPRSPAMAARIEESVRALANQALSLQHDVSGDVIGAISTMIAQIDASLRLQVDEILHHPVFQRLESTWRGLHFLVKNCETAEDLKIRVWDISKRDLAMTLRKYMGPVWDQSPISRALHTEEYGIFGGEPYACMIGDYEFSHHPRDVETLSEMAKICSAALAPFIMGASPQLFGMDSWRDLVNPRDLGVIPRSAEYAAWKALRASEDSRFLVLTMPRFLARLPYGSKTDPVDAFDYEEDIGEVGSPTLPLCNASYAMAVNIARAFRLYGICARIRGVESGGVIPGVPSHTAVLSDGGIDMKCPTEIGITDRREAELAQMGLNALCHFKNTDYAVFISAQTLCKAPTFNNPEATANVALATRLPYLMSVCQFGRTMRCLLRDQVGAFRTAEQIERMLNEWLNQYVAPEARSSSSEDRARRPLSSAKVKVSESPGAPGAYSIQLEITPAYQLEGLSAPMRLTLSS